jgi:hypothetical protein
MVRFLLAALVTTGAALTIFEVRTPHGVGFVQQNSPTSSKYLIETMGGGVALFDYNNDGRLDVLLVNSGYLAPSMQLSAKLASVLEPLISPGSRRYLHRCNPDGGSG